jgi:hypothetical protein
MVDGSNIILKYFIMRGGFTVIGRKSDVEEWVRDYVIVDTKLLTHPPLDDRNKISFGDSVRKYYSQYAKTGGIFEANEEDIRGAAELAT